MTSFTSSSSTKLSVADLCRDGVWRVMIDLFTMRQKRVTQRLHNHINNNIYRVRNDYTITAATSTGCSKTSATKFLSLNIDKTSQLLHIPQKIWQIICSLYCNFTAFEIMTKTWLAKLACLILFILYSAYQQSEIWQQWDNQLTVQCYLHCVA